MNGSTNASNIGGTVGSDTKPIKIVNGVATAVTYTLLTDATAQNITADKYFVGSHLRFRKDNADNRPGTIYKTNDTDVEIMDIRVDSEHNNADAFAILRLAMFKSSGNAALYLIKRINGTTTQTLLHSF